MNFRNMWRTEGQTVSKHVGVREQLANKYISGSGIEIGALHFPQPVPEGTKVTYVDVGSAEEMQEKFKEVEVKKNLITVDNAETLELFNDDHQDFVIANHVLEHCEDVIGTLKNWVRVLKPGGKLFIALPDKEQTFDKLRPITPFSHLVSDHLEGPKASREHHYREWYALSEEEDGKDIEAKVSAAMASHQNIHWHVWDEMAMWELFVSVTSFVNIRLLEYRRNGIEVVWILERWQ